MPRAALVLLLAASTTACLRSSTVVSLRPDGSGTIVQETGVSPQAMAMLKGLGNSQGQAGQMPTELFNEEQAKKTAEAMGVRFVSMEPIKSAQLEGARAHFAFDDIRKIQMKMSQDPTGGLGGNAGSAEPPFGFEFERRGESSVLTIKMPQEKPSFGPMGQGLGGPGTTPEQNMQAIQMMKMMMQGLFVDVALDIDGRIIKTTAPHVSGTRLTLLQLDFDKLLADESALMKLQGATDLKALGGVPGLKIITEPRVTVEFGK